MCETMILGELGLEIGLAGTAYNGHDRPADLVLIHADSRIEGNSVLDHALSRIVV
jgi:hypothetical protein